MNKTTFILLGVTYYIVSVLIIIIVLNKINKKGKNKYKQEIEELERDKNQIISSDIMSSLQTVEEFVNNDLMQEVYTNLRTRFDVIKKEDIPHITDNLLKLEDLYDSKKYKELNKLLSNYKKSESLENFLTYWFIENYKLVFDKLYLQKSK